MHCSLPYGAGYVACVVPDSTEVLDPTVPTALDNPNLELEAVLRAPLGAASLLELARGKRSACVVISDITRPRVGHWVLPALLETLRAAHIENIEILIATGTHRAATNEEIQLLAGPALAAGVRVRSHEASRGAHDLVGETTTGTPVWIDCGYTRADLRIIVGVVEPHLMAGYSGGGKSVCPGIARLDSVHGIHRASVARGRVGPGIAHGNPFRAEVQQAALLAGVDFSLQCCVNRDGQPTFVTAGALDSSVDAATRFAASHARVSLREPCDVVVVSGGGQPLDRTLYQAAKGWATAAAIVKPGGDLILVAEMRDGLGAPEFAALLDAGLLNAERPPGDTPSMSGQTGQWMLQHILEARARARLHVICALPEDRLRRIGLVPHPCLGVALAAVGGTNPTRRIAVLPQGPYCVPMLGEQLVTLAGARVS